METNKTHFTVLEQKALSEIGGWINEDVLENLNDPDYLVDTINDFDEDDLEWYIDEFFIRFKWVDNDENRELICEKLKEEAMQ
jgi:hypothetical protein